MGIYLYSSKITNGSSKFVSLKGFNSYMDNEIEKGRLEKKFLPKVVEDSYNSFIVDKRISNKALCYVMNKTLQTYLQ